MSDPYTPASFFSQDEINSLQAILVNNSDENILQDLCDEAVQKVRDFTLKYNVEAERQRRLVRAILKREAYAAVGQGVPEALEKSFDDAMKELRDIRDGKFPDLLIETPPDPALAVAPGSFGGKRNILRPGWRGAVNRGGGAPGPLIARGTFNIPQGVDAFAVPLSLAFTPGSLEGTLVQPPGGLQLFWNLVGGTLSQTGFSITLSGFTDSALYQFQYRVSA